MATGSTPQQSSGAAASGRKAAGTKDLKDVFAESLLRRSAKRPEDDLADLRLGTVLFVSAFRRSGRGFKQGRLALELTAPEPVIWQPWQLFRRYGPGMALRGPYSVQTVGPATGTGPGRSALKRDLFQLISMHAAGQPWDLVVPMVDVELVLTALEEANRISA